MYLLLDIIFLLRSNPLMNTLQSYISTIGQFPLLSEEETDCLFNQYREGSEIAKKKLVNHNLKLVIKVAYRYEKNNPDFLMDLISEGNFGLIRAVEKFDQTKGVKFGTYAWRWIQFRIEQEFGKSHQAAYYGDAASKLIRKVKKRADKLEREGFRGNVTVEVTRILNEEGSDISLDEVAELLPLSSGQVSFDQTIADEANMHSFIAAKDDVDEIATIENLTKWVMLKINSLPQNQKFAALCYFNDSKTYKEIGEDIGKSAQRVQQIVKEVKGKLIEMARVEKIDIACFAM